MNKSEKDQADRVIKERADKYKNRIYEYIKENKELPDSLDIADHFNIPWDVAVTATRDLVKDGKIVWNDGLEIKGEKEGK